MNGWIKRVKTTPDKKRETLVTPDKVEQLVWAAKNMLHRCITTLNNLPDSVHKQEIDTALLDFCSALERKVALGTDAHKSLKELGKAIESEQNRLYEIVIKDDAAAAEFLKDSKLSEENTALFFEALNGEVLESLENLRSFLTFKVELRQALEVSVKALVHASNLNKNSTTPGDTNLLARG